MGEGDLVDSSHGKELYLKAFGLEPTMVKAQDTGSTREYGSRASPKAQGDGSSTLGQRTYSRLDQGVA